MSGKLRLKYFFHLICYLYLFLFPQIGTADPIKTDSLSGKQFFVAMDGLENDIFLDPRLNQTWEKAAVKIWQATRVFLSFSIENRFTVPFKTYHLNNLYLDFNFPLICYKFPLSEHTEEG